MLGTTVGRVCKCGRAVERSYLDRERCEDCFADTMEHVRQKAHEIATPVLGLESYNIVAGMIRA